MDRFEEVLATVRQVICHATPSTVVALLDKLMEENVLSKEYHLTLSKESDKEDLARKIVLAVLEKGDSLLPFLYLHLHESWQLPSRHAIPSDMDASGACLWDSAMEPTAIADGGFCNLLNSELDFLTYLETFDQTEDISEDFNQDLSSVFDVILEDENEEDNRKPNTNVVEDAARIAGILKFLQDDVEKTINLEDFFAKEVKDQHLQDEATPKRGRTCTSTVTRSRSRKRKSTSSQTLSNEAQPNSTGNSTPLEQGLGQISKAPARKRKPNCQRKTAEQKVIEQSSNSTTPKCRRRTRECSSTLPVVNGHFMAIPASAGVVSTPSGPVSHIQVQLPLANLKSSGKPTFLTTVPSLGSIPQCNSSGGIQLLPAFTAVPQQIIRLPVSGTTQNIIIVSSPPQVSPPHSPLIPISPPDVTQSLGIQGIPQSPDRNVPMSPSTPSITDMPNTPGSSAGVPNESPDEVCQRQLSDTVTEREKSTEKPKSVEEYTKIVKEYLKDICEYMTMECDALLEAHYTDVTLIQGQLETKTGRTSTKGLEKEIVIYDEAEKEKVTIERWQMLDFSGGKPKETKLVALVGRAGMGKSILVQKICQDWSQGEFSQFEFVFWFECRRLNGIRKSFSLKDLLFEVFAKPQEKTEEVFRYVLRNPEKVLLIFDGFDELPDLDGFMNSSACCSFRDSGSIKELFAGLFQKRLLNGCAILITARTKEAFNPYLAKVDKIVEIIGFSSHQINTYISKYFAGTNFTTDALELIENNQFVLSYCYSPLICRFVCFVCELVLKTGDRDLPKTLTGLYLIVFQQLINRDNSIALQSNCSFIVKLLYLAWNSIQKHQIVVFQNDLDSKETKEFALGHKFLFPFPLNRSPEMDEFGNAFGSTVLQNFLGALHLIMTPDVRAQSLIKQVTFEKKRKRCQEDWLDMVRRFLSGLLFLNNNDQCLNFLSSNSMDSLLIRKAKSLSNYLKELHPSELSPSKLLELCHCVYETQDVDLIGDIASKIGDELSMAGTRLTPPDAFVLRHILAKARKNLAIDLRNTGIDLLGLEQLVSLPNVTLFRAPTGDTIKLWQSLQHRGGKALLRRCMEKFTINPLKLRSMKDVDDLTALIQIQEEGQLYPCTKESSFKELQLPAIRDLHKIEFALGPVSGSQGFLKLAELLTSFPCLQHLDLEALSENKIGDKGVEKLTDVFPNLTVLETLNLSQNSITDKSAEKLAKALPSLISLKTLSLYSNCISDAGAEYLAETLPEMKSLSELDVKYNRITDVGAKKLTESLKKCPGMKSIALWNTTIPHAVLEHLKKEDPRIDLL
ncbi:MHC class II transactivator isoform X3 [Protopterus annectens]|uniref:MHC class II transactivator isoform X3 n=1 Tax=Protopterus annectens TaxID=7888 RepID=UPI001CFB3963|nr:MHC class II transactivator isoform X3 [Protopterus annectens]